MPCIAEFSIERVLGSGSFGSVALAKNMNVQRFGGSPYVAVKTVSKRSGQRTEEIANEASAMKTIKSKYVPRLHEAFEDDTNWYFVMEYAPGRDLFSMVMFIQSNRLSFKKSFVRSIFNQMAESVFHIHSQAIAHLDIKLENFMIECDEKSVIENSRENFENSRCNPTASNDSALPPTEPQVKLIDFGLCERVRDSSQLSRSYCTRWIGSPDYMAPELLLKTPYRPDKADIFSLGVVLYILLLCEIPFVRNERTKAASQGFHPSLRWPSNKKVSNKAKDLIEKMLAVDPRDRIDMEGVLEHPWLNRRNIINLRNTV